MFDPLCEDYIVYINSRNMTKASWSNSQIFLRVVKSILNWWVRSNIGESFWPRHALADRPYTHSGSFVMLSCVITLYGWGFPHMGHENEPTNQAASDEEKWYWANRRGKTRSWRRLVELGWWLKKWWAWWGRMHHSSGWAGLFLVEECSASKEHDRA